jgi:hypothetical protein
MDLEGAKSFAAASRRFSHAPHDDEPAYTRGRVQKPSVGFRQQLQTAIDAPEVPAHNRCHYASRIDSTVIMNDS